MAKKRNPNKTKQLVEKTALSDNQTVARTTQGNTLNYNSVNVLEPARLASAFREADHGYITKQAELFELIEERDPYVYSQLAKRRMAVTGLPWQLNPPKDATQSEIDRTKELEDIIRNIENNEDAMFDVTDAIGKGFAALELNWEAGETWRVKTLDFVPQRCFQTDIDTKALQYLNMGMPEPLRPFKWLIHEHRAKSGYFEQTALFRVLAWIYPYKSYNTKDLMRFLELYGIPLRLGKYPAGIQKEQQDQLLRAVRSIGNDGAGIIAANMAIDFIQAQNGNVEDFLKAQDYWEQKQAQVILGGDLDGKTSTEARIMIYDKGRREILLHDANQIEPSIKKGLIKPIALVNGLFPEDRLPSFKYITEESADRKAIADVIDILVNKAKLPISEDWAYKELQIPKPKDGEKVLGATEPVKPVDPKTALTAALTQQLKTDPPSLADAYSVQLANACVPLEIANIERIGALLTEAGSFEQAMATLTTASQTKPSADLINKLTEGGMAANLAGRTDIK